MSGVDYLLYCFPFFLGRILMFSRIVCSKSYRPGQNLTISDYEIPSVITYYTGCFFKLKHSRPPSKMASLTPFPPRFEILFVKRCCLNNKPARLSSATYVTG